MRRAVGVYITDGQGKVLLGKRGPRARHEHGKWESVGGEVEPGESFRAAARREVMEEAGVAVVELIQIGEFKDLKDETDEGWHARKFLATVAGEPRVMEREAHTELAWFSLDEMAQLDLASYASNDRDMLKAALVSGEILRPR